MVLNTDECYNLRPVCYPQAQMVYKQMSMLIYAIARIERKDIYVLGLGWKHPLPPYLPKLTYFKRLFIFLLRLVFLKVCVSKNLNVLFFIKFSV